MTNRCRHSRLPPKQPVRKHVGVLTVMDTDRHRSLSLTSSFEILHDNCSQYTHQDWHAGPLQAAYYYKNICMSIQELKYELKQDD